MVTDKARRTLKLKVLKAMAYQCSKLSQINQTHNQISIDHYKTLCKGMLREWKDLAIEK